MKFFLVLSALIAAANAGGKTLSVQESEQHLRNFNIFCSPGGSGQNQDGNTMYYCKTADEPITLKIDHEEELDAGETPKQVIYIQPPPYVYRHNVGILGSPGSPQQTEIYVLPQKATHELSVSDQRTRTQGAKPQLYFLSGSGQESGSSGGERRPANAPLSPPNLQPLGHSAPASGPTYLPPRPNTGYGQPYARAQRNVVSGNGNGNGNHYTGSTYPQQRPF